MAALEEYLARRGLWHRFVEKAETVHTRDAAAAAGLELARVTKNLVSVTAEGGYALLVIPGDRRVNLTAAAKALGTGSVRLVPFERAESISGYPPGGTPTVGHRTPMRVVFDGCLLGYETFYCGGGARTRLVELKTLEVLEAAEAIVAEICAA
ncbi:MAG: YbaK/EbsC family protein [Candidatus Bathyarchaeia archaeon]